MNENPVAKLKNAYKAGLDTWVNQNRQLLSINPPGRPPQKSMFEAAGVLQGFPTGPTVPPVDLDKGTVPSFFTTNAFTERNAG